MPDSPSTELATVDELREYLVDGRVPEIEDPHVTQMRIIDAILTADDEDQVFNTSGTTAAVELLGVPLEIRDVTVKKSEIADALPVYMLLDCLRGDTGELITVNTGAPTIMAQAWWLKAHGRLPRKVTVIAKADAKPGQSPPLGLASL